MGGQTPQEAEAALAGTLSNDKNELLFSRFGINYNNEDAIWRKGSVVFRDFRDKDKGAGMESVGTGETGGGHADAVDSAASQSPQPAQPQSRTQSQTSSTLPRNTNTSTHLGTNPQPGQPPSKSQLAKQRKRHAKAVITVEHVDIIKDAFWEERPWILGDNM